MKDHTGLKFGRLTAVERIARLGEKTRYRCTCSCGQIVTIKSNSLVSGNTRSCGCLNEESLRNSGVKHGMRKSPEYSAFQHMWKRTTNVNDKDYEQYRERTPPDSWKDFRVFFAEVGLRPSPKHSLDRIDNKKSYGPGNVRWATTFEQANNTSKNVALTFNGKTQNVSQWARELGIHVDALYGRLRRGWSAEKTLSLPAQQPRDSRRELVEEEVKMQFEAIYKEKV